MSKILILTVILSGLSSALYAQYVFQTGDIIFHISKSQQSLSIQKATHSPYSHMGMIVNKNNQTWVLEAIQPVQYTTLNKWIARGENAHYVVKRLKQPLNVQQKTTLVQNAERYLGKPYDIYFEWDDRAIYCSEIVWKAYQHALGIELSPLQQLKQFDLKQYEVQRLMRQRYGQNIPLNEQVIAPKAIYDSKLLKEIFRN
ncbi:MULTISPECIES: YiiX family permuted papain-like enzyme [unclassified Acinetobacter]|uniref:YiiX family permuted papain-like enzyme n=1 Tax=unclassified Acinetobacter TaxID=196816 RepID=UPI0015D2CFFB|nr:MULTISPECIES: YiiX family permuted papain-like enzyme [unclassified Acinetobacter]UUS64328.1 YiiX family permuted papain-like enzyme [Acinetobacter sp. YH12068_T]